MIGIGESVNVRIDTWMDIDTYVDDLGEEWQMEDTLGTVEWFTEGPGFVVPDIGMGTWYYAPISPVNASACVQATAHDSGTRGLDPETNYQVSFNILIPTGARAWHDADNPLGDQGPPDNSIGAMSTFLLQTLPDTVNFWVVPFRERIDYQVFTWPNGSQYVAGPFTSEPFAVLVYGETPNMGTDVVVTGGPWDVERLMDPVTHTYQSRQFNVVPFLQFHAEGDWHIYAAPAHPRSFSGDTFEARVGWGSIWGGWQGPYQNPGQ